jgi:hypothetical protein
LKPRHAFISSKAEISAFSGETIRPETAHCNCNCNLQITVTITVGLSFTDKEDSQRQTPKRRRDCQGQPDPLAASYVQPWIKTLKKPLGNFVIP